MCGRYSQKEEFSEVALAFRAEPDLFRDYLPLYNIAPTRDPGHEQLVVLTRPDGRRVLRLARWWMIPAFWSRPLRELPTSFNARAEDLEGKPFWRDAFLHTRCLVPATGWREFTGEPRRRRPHHFRLQSELFAFAGLWSSWVSPEGEVVDSFAIVTTEPSAAAAPIHDRMPLVVPPELYDAWLDPARSGTAVLQAAVEGSRTRTLEVHPSDPVANDVRYEGPRAIEPAPPETQADPAQQELFRTR